MMKKLFFCLGVNFLCYLSFPAQATVKADSTTHSLPVFSGAQIKADFNILRETLEKEHGGIYKFTSKKEFDRLFDSISNRLDTSMNLMEFYNLVSLCIAKVHCSHTRLLWPKEMYDYLHRELFFPLLLVNDENKIYVEYDFTKDSCIAKGSEIKEINGRPMQEIQEKIFSHLPADGYIRTSKYRELESGLFSIYYKLLINTGDSFAVAYVSPDGRPLRKTIAGIPHKKIMSVYRNQLQKEEHESVVSFSMLKADSIPAGYLKISSFSLGKRANTVLDSIFETISKSGIQNLIIDIRDNGGGDASNMLYSYLTSKPFVCIDSAYLRTRKFHYVSSYSAVPSLAVKLLNKFSGLVVKKAGPEKYLIKKNFITKMFGAGKELGVQAPAKKYNYSGKLAVLINGNSYSEAAIFSSIIHSSKRGILIGEESGGNYRGPTSGIIAMIELPATKMKVTVPLLQIVTHVSGNANGWGTIPDCVVNENINDRMLHKDRVLDAALERIKKGKN